MEKAALFCVGAGLLGWIVSGQIWYVPVGVLAAVYLTSFCSGLGSDGSQGGHHGRHNSRRHRARW
jgi:hypothetical protein